MNDTDLKDVSKDYETFDFHIHSNFSFDSLLTARKIIKIATMRGLHGVAITDHNTIKGGVKARRILNERKKDLQIIVGEEVRTEFGDLIGLFLTEEIKSKQFDEVVDEIKEQEGIVVLPHPFKSMNTLPRHMIDKLDAIEGLNGRTQSLLNKKAQQIAHKYNIPLIGGSDAHLSREIGMIQTLIPKKFGNISDSKSFKKALIQEGCLLIGKESPKYLCYVSLGIKILKTGHV